MQKNGGDFEIWALKYNLPPVLGQICWLKTKQQNKEDYKKITKEE